MKYILLTIMGISLLLPLMASAETEDEEMARIQRELNRRLFDLPSAPEPPPPPPVPAPVTRVEPAPVEPTPIKSAPVEEVGALPISTFTNYQLAGVTLGMAKSDVVAKLEAEGYGCNMGQMKGMAQMLGRSVCVYASMEAPKVAMFTLRNGQVRDFELSETYKTGFPEEIFKQAKQKFMASYASHAKCKAQRRGELCEVFGHGYRIVLSSKISSDDLKITHSVHTM